MSEVVRTWNRGALGWALLRGAPWVTPEQDLLMRCLRDRRFKSLESFAAAGDVMVKLTNRSKYDGSGMRSSDRD